MTAKELYELEKTGKYVFHGSPKGDIEVLETRQGTHTPDRSKPTEVILDGAPAVSATPYVDLAIFRALINSVNIPYEHRSGFGRTKDGKKEFRVSSKKILEDVKGKRGYIYVLDKNSFQSYNRGGRPFPQSMEWRSYTAVRPLQIIEVTSDYLPPENEIEIV